MYFDLIRFFKFKYTWRIMSEKLPTTHESSEGGTDTSKNERILDIPDVQIERKPLNTQKALKDEEKTLQRIAQLGGSKLWTKAVDNEAKLLIALLEQPTASQ